MLWEADAKKVKITSEPAVLTLAVERVLGSDEQDWLNKTSCAHIEGGEEMDESA